MTDLTERLEHFKARHQRTLDSLGAAVAGSAPEPRDEPAWDPPASDVLPNLDCEDLDGAGAVELLLKRFERLGLSAEASASDALDLVVQCGSATGLLSLAVFGVKVSRERIDQVRTDLAAIGGCAATIVIKLCQFEGLGLHKWVKPAVEPEPSIPVGTATPMVEEFEAALFSKFLAGDPWPSSFVSAAEIPRGYSTAMPNWAEPNSDHARGYQQALVRRYARTVMEAVSGGEPRSFVFIWGMDRIEIHTICSPTDLLVYCMKGPETFGEFGGSLICAWR